MTTKQEHLYDVLKDVIKTGIKEIPSEDLALLYEDDIVSTSHILDIFFFEIYRELDRRGAET